jgi:hypothetical protein
MLPKLVSSDLRVGIKRIAIPHMLQLLKIPQYTTTAGGYARIPLKYAKIRRVTTAIPQDTISYLHPNSGNNW